MSTDLPIRRPRYPIAATHKYRLTPRAKTSFNTVLKASEFIDKGGANHSEVRVEAEETGDITVHFEHPLISGVIRESLTMLDTPEGLICGRLVRTVHAAADKEVRREEVDFHAGVLPLPKACYPEVMLPFLLSWQPFDTTKRSLYAWINDRFVATVQYQSVGATTVDLPSGRRDAHEMVMWPDLNDWIYLGRVLTKMSYPLVPKYRMWFDPKEPHTVLRFEGPYGPPGAPEVVLELLD